MTQSKIVLDTNVWIGALLGPGGPARDIVRICLQGHYQPQMGNALFQEYRDVMAREELMQAQAIS